MNEKLINSLRDCISRIESTKTMLEKGKINSATNFAEGYNDALDRAIRLLEIDIQSIEIEIIIYDEKV
jgi:hypothetical protein